jgi:hypothetical protein
MAVLPECFIATGDGTESFADESRLNGEDCAIVGLRIGSIAAPERQVLLAAQTRDQNSERDGPITVTEARMGGGRWCRLGKRHDLIKPATEQRRGNG